MLLAYAIYRLDPVFMLGQAMGLVIYGRNIYFIRTHHKSEAAAAARRRPRRVNGCRRRLGRLSDGHCRQ